jgi:protein MpaA
MDWYGKAKQLWTDVRERSPKHFPGYFPNSEIETIFQIQLIDDYRPDKILSVHAPLGWLDYDGPGDGRPRRPLTASEVRAKRLVKAIAENAKNYKVVDYTFFPGSLGNYAGNERRIPTVTLELKSTSPKMVEAYWQQFLPGLMQSFRYPYRLNLEREDGHNATPFSAEYAQRPKRTI